MKKITFVLLIASLYTWLPLPGQHTAPGPIALRTCLTETESDLAARINAYRESKGLKPVPISVSLSTVALTHCQDLDKHYRHSGRCNLHSWSDDGPWSPCCYTPDHKRAACIWAKPGELTPYPGDGFEIAYYNSRPPVGPEAYAKDILESWKGSPGHNNMIINRGIWDDVEWKAMGIGVWNGYATVWFGKEEDPEGVPGMCGEEMKKK